ncbi:hypothetical protein [Paraprevotella xylaniphila]|uniref:hypothetical protein n=1 Tax=Paraprevotella xylaniphila TaxID=454155 RepID=UPI0039F4EFF4
MKKYLYIFMSCMLAVLMVGCGGRSNSTEADRIAQLEDSIRKIQSDKALEPIGERVIVASETYKKVNVEEDAPKREEQGLKGASSRNDFPSVLSGTTWMTDQQDSNVDRKFEFKGNTAIVYNSKPRWNYDDPLEWYNAGPNGYDNPPYVITFHAIKEPRKGYYNINYRKDPSGNTGMFNFEVKGNKFYLVERGGKYILLKEI